MKRILFYFLIFIYSFNYSQGSDCALFSLADDLENSTDDFKSFFNTEGSINAYKVLLSEEKDIRTSTTELVFVDDYLKTTNKQPQILIDEIKEIGTYTIWKSTLGSADGLAKRIDEFKNRIKALNEGQGLPKLTSKFEGLNDSNKEKFLDDFDGASDKGLEYLEQNNRLSEIISTWKNRKEEFLSRIYKHPQGDQMQILRTKLNDPQDIKLFDQVVAADFNSQYVLAGGYFDYRGLSQSEIDKLISKGIKDEIIINTNITKYNNVGLDGNSPPKIEAYRNYRNTLDPITQKNIDYLDVIREDVKEGGKLYKKLLNFDMGDETAVSRKIQSAGKPGTHAEVIVRDRIIKSLRDAGINPTDDILKRIKVMVRNKNEINMCRCPNCFHIIGDKVKMILND